MLAKMTDEGSLFYVRMQCLSKPITAFRVDMLGFPPLPKGGPGQASDGTFILHHVKIGKYISKGSEPKWYEISKAYASNNADGFPVENALVDDTKGWAIDSDQVGKHHHAVFVLTEPIRSGNLHVIKLVFDKSDHRPPLRVRVHYTTAEDPAKVTNLLAPPAHLKMESPEPDPDQPETDPKKPKPGQPKPGLKLPSLHAIDFVTLNPGTAQSEKGVELTLNDMDGSITAGNNPGVRDVYTVYAETAIEGVTALRLEALPDDSLPKDGPGWGTGGKFSIVEIEVFAKKKGDPGQPQPIEIKRATADMAIPGKEIGKAIDGKKNTFWLVQGKPGEKRVATLMFEKPIGDKGGTEIVVSLSNGIGLGRFRLMVTSMKDPLRK
jgi:hypothetical protein